VHAVIVPRCSCLTMYYVVIVKRINSFIHSFKTIMQLQPNAYSLFNLFRKHIKMSFVPLLLCVYQVLIVEAAHTFGLCLFVYKVLPAYDIIRALLLTCATSIVPSALKLLLTKGGRSPLSVIGDICALLMQCSVFFLVTMFTHARTFQLPDSLHLLELCASAVLISLRYWENFIDRDIGTIAVQNFKQTLRIGRCKMYIFASIWKIALTLAFAYLLIPQVRVTLVIVISHKSHL